MVSLLSILVAGVLTAIAMMGYVIAVQNARIKKFQQMGMKEPMLFAPGPPSPAPSTGIPKPIPAKSQPQNQPLPESTIESAYSASTGTDSKVPNFNYFEQLLDDEEQLNLSNFEGYSKKQKKMLEDDMKGLQANMRDNFKKSRKEIDPVRSRRVAPTRQEIRDAISIHDTLGRPLIDPELQMEELYGRGPRDPNVVNSMIPFNKLALPQ